jgi:hypothetical protein
MHNPLEADATERSRVAAGAKSRFIRPSIVPGGTCTLTILNLDGTADTGYSGTVQITSSDPKAVLPGNVTITGGTGTSTVALETAGTQSVAATSHRCDQCEHHRRRCRHHCHSGDDQPGRLHARARQRHRGTGPRHG